MASHTLAIYGHSNHLHLQVRLLTKICNPPRNLPAPAGSIVAVTTLEITFTHPLEVVMQLKMITGVQFQVKKKIKTPTVVKHNACNYRFLYSDLLSCIVLEEFSGHFYIRLSYVGKFFC